MTPENLGHENNKENLYEREERLEVKATEGEAKKV